MKNKIDAIVAQVGKIVLGKEEQIRLALTCLFARGHLLIEDLPGIGKTTLAKVLAKCLGLHFQRVQFTSDMLPGDILGTSVFNQDNGSFVFHPGPIFSQVLLTDEINRATPKTQSALLEAMEESQVTVEGETRHLNRPFFVIATQNPLEHAGTFPLPESQLDRFLMRIRLGYPGRAAERQLLKGEETKTRIDRMPASLTGEEVLALQESVSAIHASDPFLEYLQDLVAFTRNSPLFVTGLSPRAGLGLLQASKSWALLQGRPHTLPEDLQTVLPWIAVHRLRLRETLGEVSHDHLRALLQDVPIP